jgi:hypothetical protein
LYPWSLGNFFALVAHGFLFVLEALFILTLPLLVVLPIWTAVAYVGVVFGVVWFVCFLLNGTQDVVKSRIDLGDDEGKHADECWIYLNGVSIGHHWLQTNADRLALTFRRHVTGVHNRTLGIIFDLVQCIVERNFSYATEDIRRSYAVIKESLLDEKRKKVVLILHSQGGIEGGLILDWLLSELPHDIIYKLEIYTFGSAANHFNNPPRSLDSAGNGSPNSNAVRHIEHYADNSEFVACWGVLTFARIHNRFMGHIFIRPGTGHLLNMHYLNAMFPLGQDKRVLEHNDFMDMDVDFTSDGAADKAREGFLATLLNNGNGTNRAVIEDLQDGLRPVGVSMAEQIAAKKFRNTRKVRDFSRLWCYRNGGSPKSD